MVFLPGLCWAPSASWRRQDRSWPAYEGRSEWRSATVGRRHSIATNTTTQSDWPVPPRLSSSTGELTCRGALSALADSRRVTAPAAELDQVGLSSGKDRGTTENRITFVEDGGLTGRDAAGGLAEADPHQIAVRGTDSRVDLPVGTQLH